MLPDTRVLARQLAERIRQSLCLTPMVTTSGDPLSVTASLGVVSLPPSNSVSIDALLSLTHDTLYQSKRDGRTASRVTSIIEIVWDRC